MSELLRNPETRIVGIGSTVDLLYDGDPIEDAITIQIVRGAEGKSDSGAQYVSHDSRVGRAIMDKEAGEYVSFAGPNGDLVIVKIIAVR